MFRTVPLSIIRSFSLYTQPWYMSYSLWAGSGFHPDPTCKLSANLYDIPLLCVQWKTPDDGQRNCVKRVEFQSKNKFEKSVYLIGFIIRICHDARSHERHIRYIWFVGLSTVLTLEDPGLLGCGVVSLNGKSLTFRRSHYLQNILNYSLDDLASHPTRPRSSSALPQKREIWH